VIADRVELLAGEDRLLPAARRRAAVRIRALVTRPRVTLADEATGDLDSGTAAEIMGLFQELWREGITLVLVTHGPDFAAYASRVLMMALPGAARLEAGPDQGAALRVTRATR
jgi:ABC-type lipoprotein export system ATPase subunit